MIATNTPMIEMATSSSISVNANLPAPNLVCAVATIGHS
jgi:hypothetical protein